MKVLKNIKLEILTITPLDYVIDPEIYTEVSKKLTSQVLKDYSKRIFDKEKFGLSFFKGEKYMFCLFKDAEPHVICELETIFSHYNNL